MTPASPQRSRFRLPAAVALCSLLLGLAGTTSSESLPASSRVLPLELARMFPNLNALPEILRATPAPEPVTAARTPQFLLTPPPEAAADGGIDPEAAQRYLLSLPFGREIRHAAARNRVDELLVASIVEAESSFRADAVSEKGALGLMQLMPFHLEGVAEPLDPAVNLALGTGYLAQLEARYEGDVRLTLAAYHAGPGAVARWGGVPPYASTRHYVDRVMALYRGHRERVGEQAAHRQLTTLGLTQSQRGS